MWLIWNSPVQVEVLKMAVYFSVNRLSIVCWVGMMPADTDLLQQKYNGFTRGIGGHWVLKGEYMSKSHLSIIPPLGFAKIPPFVTKIPPSTIKVVYAKIPPDFCVPLTLREGWDFGKIEGWDNGKEQF